MILPIYIYNHPVLRQPTIEVSKNDFMFNDLKLLVRDMYETMHNADGSGLAAPQIGSNGRILVIETEITDGVVFKGTFINPQILTSGGELFSFTEGCLSLPGIQAQVVRPGIILLHWFDEDWKEHKETFSGLPGRILQHEIDHLDGKLFIDHLEVEDKLKLSIALSKIEQKEIEYKYATI